MPEFTRVASLSEIPENGAICVHLGGTAIGLFRIGGEVFAIGDICPHAHAHLSEGEIMGDEVACPLHFATFNIRTGECTGPPADEDVETYPVRIEGDDVLVGIEGGDEG